MPLNNGDGYFDLSTRFCEIRIPFNNMVMMEAVTTVKKILSEATVQVSECGFLTPKIMKILFIANIFANAALLLSKSISLAQTTPVFKWMAN